MASRFTWIPVFKAISGWISDYEERQPELVSILKKIGIDVGLEDRDENGNAIALQEIDPFTFFCMFTKYGVEKRKQLFARLIQFAGLDVPPPSDFDGVPTANAQKAWMFPYKAKRQHWMIPTLWELFHQCKAVLDATTFERALRIPDTGFAKLTEALFYVEPNRYFPVDKQTRPWLEEAGVLIPKKTLPEYLKALQEVSKRSSKSFAELSLDAYEKNQGTPFDTQEAKAYLENRYPNGGSATKYIAAFQTSQGRQIALSASLTTEVKLFVDAKPPHIPDARVESYPPKRPRNSNLDTNAPKLGTDHQAYYVQVVSKGELAQLCEWYESKSAGQPAPSLNPSPAMTTQPLNQILYGPPGTGKTFATIDKALAILDPEFTGTRAEKKLRFDKYVETEQIKFVTFHQSFSYEDFVEGIRADTNETTHQLEYEIQDGIFKQLCNAARPRVVQSSAKAIDPHGRRIWKISLGEAGIEEGVYQDCIDQGLALIGFGGNADYSGAQSREDIALKYRQAVADNGGSDYPVTALNTFIRQVKIGDLFVVTQGNLRFRAIGEVTSDYQFVPREADSYSQGRKVNWLRVYDSGLPYGELMENRFSQMTIYELRAGSINLDKLSQLLAPKKDDLGDAPPRVLIIDEINRGNISRVFGELITLIEDSRRAGKPEALEVLLPYSKAKFSVPSNVYLIGTMNTADRSLAGLDIALRRRFKFEEMPPQPSALKERTVAGVPLQQLLITINRRIEVLLGRDFLLGHAYFLQVETLPALADVFRRQVIPLLQEYFFEDWQRIAWVLNDHAKTDDAHKFLTKEVLSIGDVFGSGVDLPQANDLWRINEKAFAYPESYAGILKVV